MARTPYYKVYDANGDYRASTKHPAEAAAVITLLGKGATIRASDHKRILWHEGQEEDTASNSYDFVTQTVYQRI